MYSTDIMIDIETLAVSPDALILTIGAQGFDPFSNRLTKDTLYTKISIESQPNRRIDEATLEWWAKQDKEFSEETFSKDDRVELRDALEQLSKIFWQASRIWANGIAFDMVILENAYNECRIITPWHFWQCMDARTIYKITPNASKLGNSHNALSDCINQIDLLQFCIAKLGLTKF